jgi:hypothetical protein
MAPGKTTRFAFSVITVKADIGDLSTTLYAISEEAFAARSEFALCVVRMATRGAANGVKHLGNLVASALSLPRQRGGVIGRNAKIYLQPLEPP